MDDALAICRLSRETGVKVGINYQYRYDAGCYALVKAAPRPARSVSCSTAAATSPGTGHEGLFQRRPWHASRQKSGGGTLLTQASHIIDIALSALGGEPVSVQAGVARRVFSDVEVEDLGMGIVSLSNGALLSVTSSMIAVPERPATIEIYGSARNGHLYRIGLSAEGAVSRGAGQAGAPARVGARTPCSGASRASAAGCAMRRPVPDPGLVRTPGPGGRGGALPLGAKAAPARPVDDRYRQFIAT